MNRKEDKSRADISRTTWVICICIGIFLGMWLGSCIADWLFEMAY